MPTVRRRLVALGLTSILATAAAQAQGYRLAAQYTVPDAAPPKLTKLVVVAISDIRDVRNRFEDKFVAHLRGKGVAAVASYPVVPSLNAIIDRERVLRFLETEGVDGILTVRGVRLDDLDEQAWAAAWEAWAEQGSTVRELIEQTVPVKSKPAKKYGIEFTLWSSPTRKVWTARTDPYKRQTLRESVSDLLLIVIQTLEDNKLLAVP